MQFRYIHYITTAGYQNHSWKIDNVGCLLLMRLRILSNDKTSQGILRAPWCSYPNSSTEASSSSANRGWFRTLISITNLVRIYFPTYTGRNPFGTIFSFFSLFELCLLFSFFNILTNANGRLEERISITLFSKRINWLILDEITEKPTFAKFSYGRGYNASDHLLQYWKSATVWIVEAHANKEKEGGTILSCKMRWYDTSCTFNAILYFKA